MRVLDALRSSGADLKVVRPESLHATLKFLGEIPDAQAPVLLARLQEAGFPSGYEVLVQGVGAFPSSKKMNVIWAGLKDSGGELSKSYALSERVFAEAAFPPEPRPFTAHVTLARKRTDRGREEARRILAENRDVEFGRVRVDAPVLFRSTLTREGAVYEALGKATP